MSQKQARLKIFIRGAGEIASGIAFRLHQECYLVCMTEVPYPLAVSRATAFSDAVFDGAKTIEQITAELTPLSVKEIERVWNKGNMAVIIDPEGTIREQLQPDVLIDARMLKKVTKTNINDARLVMGIGPGFTAGKDVHILVETNDRQGNLAKLIFQGETEENTGKPIDVGGLSNERVVWADKAGLFTSSLEIGEPVSAGQVIAALNGTPIKAPLTGHLRGLLRDGVAVTKDAKLVEVDAVNEVASFNIIREKMRIIGDAVAEAIKSNFKQ
jgi:xanthine dehydrogenase accessory factor